jgi:class 3 adenylate cyclase
MVVNQTGTEITAVFGYPTAHEDDPERAVRCGYEIIPQLNDQQTKAQIGINSGWVMIGKDGKISGDAVNLAGELSM